MSDDKPPPLDWAKPREFERSLFDRCRDGTTTPEKAAALEAEIAANLAPNRERLREIDRVLQELGRERVALAQLIFDWERNRTPLAAFAEFAGAVVPVWVEPPGAIYRDHVWAVVDAKDRDRVRLRHLWPGSSTAAMLDYNAGTGRILGARGRERERGGHLDVQATLKLWHIHLLAGGRPDPRFSFAADLF